MPSQLDMLDLLNQEEKTLLSPSFNYKRCQLFPCAASLCLPWPWLTPQVVLRPSPGLPSEVKPSGRLRTCDIGAYATQALREQDVEMGHDAPHARPCREVHTRATEARMSALAVQNVMEHIMRHGQHATLRSASTACWGIVHEMDAVLAALPRPAAGRAACHLVQSAKGILQVSAKQWWMLTLLPVLMVRCFRLGGAFGGLVTETGCDNLASLLPDGLISAVSCRGHLTLFH